MNREANDLEEFLKDREIELLLSPVKAMIKRGMPKIDVGSIHLEETKEGDIIEVPRWVGEAMNRLGLAEIQEESLDIEMFKALSRERIQGATQLSTLREDFYIKLRRYLKSLKEGDVKPSLSNQDYEKLLVSAYDLLTLRTGKLLHLTSSPSSSSDLSERITPEEERLFEKVNRMVSAWRRGILEGV